MLNFRNFIFNLTGHYICLLIFTFCEKVGKLPALQTAPVVADLLVRPHQMLWLICDLQRLLPLNFLIILDIKKTHIFRHGNKMSWDDRSRGCGLHMIKSCLVVGWNVTQLAVLRSIDLFLGAHSHCHWNIITLSLRHQDFLPQLKAESCGNIKLMRCIQSHSCFIEAMSSPTPLLLLCAPVTALCSSDLLPRWSFTPGFAPLTALWLVTALGPLMCRSL